MAKTPAPLPPGPPPSGPPVPKHDPPTPSRKHVRVRATREGFINDVRIRKGIVFTLQRDAQFSKKWMEDVEESIPDDLTAPLAPTTKPTPGPRGGRPARTSAEVTAPPAGSRDPGDVL